MTAAIIPFPNAAERADRNFGRSGSTELTWVIDEAHDLYDAHEVGDGSLEEMAPRLDSLSHAISSVAHTRPEHAHDLVLLGKGRWEIPLCLVPSFLVCLGADCPQRNFAAEA